MMVDGDLEGRFMGLTSPGPGRPKDVDQVQIDEARFSPSETGNKLLQMTVIHELGHAVNIRHHNETNIEKMVILNHGSCPRGAVTGTVSGKVACEFEWIAVQHGQNSGNQDCPMKYLSWIWYIPPSSRLVSTDKAAQCQGQNTSCVEFTSSFDTGMAPAYEGDFPKPYFDAIVTPETDRPGLKTYCTSRKGTGINALPGDQNRAGDAGLGECATELHVNDVR
jgi:hypothetical protein